MVAKTKHYFVLIWPQALTQGSIFKKALLHLQMAWISIAAMDNLIVCFPPLPFDSHLFSSECYKPSRHY
jgi:hypothetical protein